MYRLLYTNLVECEPNKSVRSLSVRVSVGNSAAAEVHAKVRALLNLPGVTKLTAVEQIFSGTTVITVKTDFGLPYSPHALLDRARVLYKELDSLHTLRGTGYALADFTVEGA